MGCIVTSNNLQSFDDNSRSSSATVAHSRDAVLALLEHVHKRDKDARARGSAQIEERAQMSVARASFVRKSIHATYPKA